MDKSEFVLRFAESLGFFMLVGSFAFAGIVGIGAWRAERHMKRRRNFGIPKGARLRILKDGEWVDVDKIKPFNERLPVERSDNYRCGVCGTRDMLAYMRCDHPGCPDGRDRAA